MAQVFVQRGYGQADADRESDPFDAGNEHADGHHEPGDQANLPLQIPALRAAVQGEPTSLPIGDSPPRCGRSSGPLYAAS